MPTTTKALGQISIIDLTDGYTVSMDRDAGSFPATASYAATSNSTVYTVNITALQGGTSITPKIGTCVIKDATGQTISNSITAVAAANNSSPVTITVYGGSSQHPFTGAMATVTIPVYVEGNPSSPNAATDVIVQKIFTISASPQGAAGASTYTHIKYAEDSSGTNMDSDPDDSRPYIGIAITNSSTAPVDASAYAPWTKYLGEDGTDGVDGADGLTYYIHSSNGTYFKNTGVNTRLTVHIYNADGEDQSIPSNLEWYKGDPNNSGTKVTDNSHRNYIDIGPSDVTNTETYYVVLETTTT